MIPRLLLTTCLALLSSMQAMSQIPKVATDTLFARGATMAFGRIKSVSPNGGSAIQIRGFCLSENPEPTVDDIINTRQFTNNGIIYYFEDLKPGTMYYMRAYATNKDGMTGYGNVIKFSTIPKGAITYTYNNGGNSDQNQRINNALTQACDIFSNLTSAKKHFDVYYSSGTPTADCNYTETPHMNIGPNSNYQHTGIIMHEIQHGLGVISYSTEWSGDILRSGNGTGQWLGDRVSAFLDFWDNTVGSRLNGDTQHMWPYGINGSHEDNGTLQLYYGNAMIGQALGEDGLQHTYNTFATPYYSLIQEDTIKYYIKNESKDRGLYTSYLKPTATGVLKWVSMTTEEAALNDSAAWYITFTPENQYYQLRNAATGQYMTYSSGIKTAAKAKLTANENWHLMRGRVDVDGQRGYWIIHPTTSWSPPCLKANTNGNTAQANFNIANSAEVQRWIFLTIDEEKVAEYKAMVQIRKQVKEQLKLVKQLAEVPHTCSDATVDEQLQTTLASIEQRMTEATSATELTLLLEEARKATNDFLMAGITPTGAPFDLTYMLVNPTIDENSDGWTGSPAISYGCGEFYEKTFDFSQTVKNLPAGTYAFFAQGFQRPGSSSSSYRDYKAGNNKVYALIYAGTKNEKLAHICDTILSRKVGKGNETAVASGKYVPNNMQAASAYFQKGMYENQVLGSVATNGGSLKVGIKSTSMPTNYWTVFDNFRLYYYGSKTTETSLTLTANAAEGMYWTTFYSGEAGYRIDNDENSCAYTATYSVANEEGTLTLHKLGKVVPAGNAVIIVGADNAVSITKDDTSSAEYNVDNDLRGVDEETAISTLGTGTFYVLSNQNSHFGFHQYAGTTMAAGKAYLQVSGTSAPARSFNIVFDGTNGIREVRGGKDADAWYNLDGRRINDRPSTKGIYIRRGRKEIVR